MGEEKYEKKKRYYEERSEEPKSEEPKAEQKAQEPKESPVKFLTWFTDMLSKNPNLKPLHMHAVQAYFRGLGIGDPAPASQYEAALKKYGL